jgi:hypothetical protein
MNIYSHGVIFTLYCIRGQERSPQSSFIVWYNSYYYYLHEQKVKLNWSIIIIFIIIIIIIMYLLYFLAC